LEYFLVQRKPQIKERPKISFFPESFGYYMHLSFQIMVNEFEVEPIPNGNLFYTLNQVLYENIPGATVGYVEDSKGGNLGA
jgi:hypothetical protein